MDITEYRSRLRLQLIDALDDMTAVHRSKCNADAIKEKRLAIDRRIITIQKELERIGEDEDGEEETEVIHIR